jgi:hypothetical protein
MRIKVQTLKSLLWIGNALMGAAILALFVDLWFNVKQKGPREWRLDKKVFEKAIAVSPSIETRGRTSGVNWSQLRNLHELNVTGKEPPPPPPPDESTTGPAPPLKPITDVLEIKALIYASDDSSIRAVSLRYKEDGDGPPRPPPPAPPVDPERERSPVRSDRAFVRPGEMVRAPYDQAPFFGKLVEVRLDGAIFSWGGEDVLVAPREMARDVAPVREYAGVDGATPTAPAETAEAREERAALARESKALGEHDWYIGTDELERIARDADALLAEINFGSTYVASEKRTRITLKEVPEGSLAFQRGFRERDILKRINGEEISSTAYISDFVKRNPNVRIFTLELERLGTRVTKTFQLAR